MKKTPIDKLSANINKILQEYEDSVVKDTGKLAKDFARKGAAAVAQEARGKGWGESTGYDKGWTSKYEENRLEMKGIIYNKDIPGLAHLLEKGHALRGGGRSHTEAFPHITPVEDKITEEFYKAVKNSL